MTVTGKGTNVSRPDPHDPYIQASHASPLHYKLTKPECHGGDFALLSPSADSDTSSTFCFPY